MFPELVANILLVIIILLPGFCLIFHLLAIVCLFELS